MVQSGKELHAIKIENIAKKGMKIKSAIRCRRRYNLIVFQFI